MSTTKEIQVKDKQAVAGPAEQTRPGPVFSPDVDIFESEKAIILLADVPGVKAEGLEIDLKEDILKITGDVSPLEGANEEVIVSEYAVGLFHREFSLSELIDQEKIEAKLEDGVLRLVLPKKEKAQPRRITVDAA